MNWETLDILMRSKWNHTKMSSWHSRVILFWSHQDVKNFSIHEINYDIIMRSSWGQILNWVSRGEHEISSSKKDIYIRYISSRKTGKTYSLFMFYYHLSWILLLLFRMSSRLMSIFLEQVFRVCLLDKFLSSYWTYF